MVLNCKLFRFTIILVHTSMDRHQPSRAVKKSAVKFLKFLHIYTTFGTFAYVHTYIYVKLSICHLWQISHIYLRLGLLIIAYVII